MGPDLYGRSYRGTDEVREGVQRFFDTYPDGRFVGTSVVVAGERGFAEWTFAYTAPDGAHAEVRGCDLFEFDGDLIRVKDAFRKVTPPS